MNKIAENSEWTTVIKPRTGWFDIHPGELWRYRDLIMLFVRRDFVAVYKQTILGPIWFLIQPILSTIVFTVIFGMVARIPTDGIPHVLFYLSGIILWNYFSKCLTTTSDTFYTNAGIFGKVYFPRLAVPISVVISNLIAFAIQFALFIAIMCFYYFKGFHFQISWYILLTPLMLIQMAALALGTGIIVSSLTTKYRDFAYLVGFGVQLWMYATPIVYPISQVPQKWHWVYVVNPMSSIVESFRYAFLGAGGMNMTQIAASAGITLFLLVAGIVLFSRIEKTFMDTV